MSSFRMLTTAALGVTTLLILLPGCSSIEDPWPQKPGPKVLTSFAPYYCFALNVAGDDAAVRCVMSETGPHQFDPTPRHAIAMRRADLFFINGLDLDNVIANKMVKASRNSKLKLVETSKAIPQRDLREGGCSCGHDHEHDHSHHDHHHVRYDPHVWLGVPEAIKMVGLIRDELKRIDPEHAAGYDERAAAYIAKLEQLHAEGRKLLADKKERKLLTFHDSLFYFARSFGLEVADAIESSPGNEPDTQTLANLVEICREKGVRHIAVEPQYDSNNSARTILRELKAKGVDAEFVTVDPLETAKASEMGADWYENKMRENLRNLAEKLK